MVQKAVEGRDIDPPCPSLKGRELCSPLKGENPKSPFSGPSKISDFGVSFWEI